MLERPFYLINGSSSAIKPHTKIMLLAALSYMCSSDYLTFHSNLVQYQATKCYGDCRLIEGGSPSGNPVDSV
jgi:hypothetical protein